MGVTEYEVRQYLHSIKILAEKRDKKLEQIDELRSVATNCVAPTDKEPIQSSGSGDKMANIVGRIVDLTEEVNMYDDIIFGRTSYLARMGEKLSDKRHWDYLKTRYIDCNGFYDTVMILDLSDSTAKRIDKKMISELTNIMNRSNHNI